MEDIDATRDIRADNTPFPQSQSQGQPMRPSPVDRSLDKTQAMNTVAPSNQGAAPPLASPSAPDLLLADAAARRKVEQDLARLGMSPEEIRRLISANANTTEAPIQPIAGPISPVSPISAVPMLPTPQPTGRAKRPSVDGLNSFAAELMASKAQAQVQAIDRAGQALPEFRESSTQERLQAEQILRDASMLRRREKYREAEAKCREALVLVPKDGAALEMLGDILQGVGRVDEALAAYRRAVEADPKRSAAERKYGDLLMRQQKWDMSDPEAVPTSKRMAVLLSLALPGLGQFHTGDIGKGVFFVLADAVCFYLIAFSQYGLPGMHGRHGLSNSLVGCMIFGVLIYIAALIDINMGAKRGGGSGWNP